MFLISESKVARSAFLIVEIAIFIELAVSCIDSIRINYCDK